MAGNDWGAGVDLSTYSSNLIVTNSDLRTTGVPPIFTLDRVIESSVTTFGYALGYVPYTSDNSSLSARAAANSTNHWDLRGTGKSYPTTIQSATLAVGDRVTCDAFRAYLTAAQTDAVLAAGTDVLSSWTALDTAVGLAGTVA
jgi:hypothetical protein